VLSTVADEVLPPLSGSRVFTAWEIDGTVLALVCVVAALYVAGVLRLRTRGVRWPAGRSAVFLVGGLGTVVVAAMSPLGTYDDTLFTVHMLQHMLLAMVAPVFLALGAPITLALRASRPKVRRGIVALLHSRLARVVTWPPLAWVHFVALPFVLYDTAWYEATLRHPVLHEWLHVQFLFAGCVFFWPLLGLDPMPRRLSYPARMLMTFLTLPFHAFLGLSIMIQTGVIARDYYAELGRTWGPSLHADQQTGGAVLWASGDLVGLLFFAVMFFQWQRADSRAALRGDRRLRREQASPAWQPAGAAGDGQPMLVRPWWEVDPGPLADRMRREGWQPEERPAERAGD
jgi:cytochrome c oxidase assembly factor CtaG